MLGLSTLFAFVTLLTIGFIFEIRLNVVNV